MSWPARTEETGTPSRPKGCGINFGSTVELLYSGHHWGQNFVLYRGVALSQGLICTTRVYLGLSEVAFIERCPHVRGGLYEGFHCMCKFRLELEILEFKTQWNL